MRHRALWLLSSVLLFARAHAQDDVGFDPERACKDAVDAEVAKGARRVTYRQNSPPNPWTKDLFGNPVFERTQNGVPAQVIYVCEGTKPSGGPIAAQIITMNRSSESDTLKEFRRQTEFLIRQLGDPCWDVSQLPTEERALLPLDGLGSQIMWKVRPQVFTNIIWAKVPNARPEAWRIVISSHRPLDIAKATEPFRTLWSKSKCAQTDADAESH
jgi:hypothetical protein